MYSGAIASNHGIKHIASAFYLAKQAGVNIDEVRLKRAEERRKEREKLSNFQTFSGPSFPHADACVHYYSGEDAPYGATNTRNANIDYDDEAFENMPDDGEEPVSDNPEPYKPLPFLFLVCFHLFFICATYTLMLWCYEITAPRYHSLTRCWWCHQKYLNVRIHPSVAIHCTHIRRESAAYGIHHAEEEGISLMLRFGISQNLV